MARILAIDYGEKRIGLAVSDPLKIIATALKTVSNNEIIEFLKNYFISEEVETIVIGLPSDQAHSYQAILTFKNKISEQFKDKNVVFEDEQFTSKLAFNSMLQSGVKKKQRRNKENIDKISACIILQNYMDKL